MQLLLRQIRDLHPLLPEGNTLWRHGQQLVFRPVDDPSAAVRHGRLDVAHTYAVHRRHVVEVQQPRLDVLLRIHGKRVVHARRIVIQLPDADGIALDRQLRLFQIRPEVRRRDIIPRKLQHAEGGAEDMGSLTLAYPSITGRTAQEQLESMRRYLCGMAVVN